MDFGPVQILVVGFEHGKLEGKVLGELRRLREHDVVRLLDLVFVRKDEDGTIEEIEISDLDPGEKAGMGAIAGALLGFGAAGEESSLLEDAEDEVWYLADEIPAGSAAGVVLLEHRWAIPLRDAIEGAGGHTLVDAWLHPQDLIAAAAAA